MNSPATGCGSWHLSQGCPASTCPCRHPGVVWTVLPASKASCHLYSLFSLASAQVLGPLTYLTESPDCPKALLKPSSTAASVQTFRFKHWHLMAHTQPGWGRDECTPRIPPNVAGRTHSVMSSWPLSSWETSLTSLFVPKDTRAIQGSSPLHLGNHSWNSPV